MRALCAFAVLVPLLGSANPLDRIAFDPAPGRPVPGEVRLVGADGAARSIREWAAGEVAFLVPVYYRCPNLCDMTLAGLATALARASSEDLPAYRVLAFSIDPRDGHDEAERTRAALSTTHGTLIDDWRLLTGRHDDIEALTRAIGFRYFYDDRQQQYAHAAGLVVLDRERRISGFLPGVRFEAREIEGALQGAVQGHSGAIPQRVLLACYDYDPATGEYSLSIMRIVRSAAVIAALALAGAITLAVFREQRHRGGARR